MPPPPLPASALDPNGRVVTLVGERWGHIVGGHPELAAHLDDILRAIEHPTQLMPGRRSGEEWFYLEGAGPSRWLKVVVSFEDGEGRVITAFARRSQP